MLSATFNNKNMIEKEKLREIVKKSVEDVWYNRRSFNPVADQTEHITEALHQALSMSGVVESADSKNLEECRNCREMVRMISTGEICPKCFC